MKLLFDQNLSPKLVAILAEYYPDSAHVFHLELDTSPDSVIRLFAAENGFAIVTKDADFPEMQSVLGSPPKVIWIRRGNCSTAAIVSILRDHYDQICALQDAAGVITIY